MAGSSFGSAADGHLYDRQRLSLCGRRIRRRSVGLGHLCRTLGNHSPPRQTVYPFGMRDAFALPCLRRSAPSKAVPDLSRALYGSHFPRNGQICVSQLFEYARKMSRRLRDFDGYFKSRWSLWKLRQGQVPNVPRCC